MCAQFYTLFILKSHSVQLSLVELTEIYVWTMSRIVLALCVKLNEILLAPWIYLFVLKKKTQKSLFDERNLGKKTLTK